jgi:hypothetical protein
VYSCFLPALKDKHKKNKKKKQIPFHRSFLSSFFQSIQLSISGLKPVHDDPCYHTVIALRFKQCKTVVFLRENRNVCSKERDFHDCRVCFGWIDRTSHLLLSFAEISRSSNAI